MLPLLWLKVGGKPKDKLSAGWPAGFGSFVSACP